MSTGVGGLPEAEHRKQRLHHITDQQHWPRMQASPRRECQRVVLSPPQPFSWALGLSLSLCQFSLPQMPRGCPDVRSGNGVCRAWGGDAGGQMAQVSTGFLLFVIRAGSSSCDVKTPKKFPSKTKMGPQTPHCTTAFVFETAPPAHPPRERQSQHKGGKL